jgi:hypothetical protein
VAVALTIGRERYGYSDRPHVRRRLLYVGLALVGLAIPLVVPLGAGAAVASSVGMIAMIYAFLPSSYPVLGVFVSLALSAGSLALAAWLFHD